VGYAATVCDYVWGVISGMGTSRGLICNLLGFAQRRSGRSAAGWRQKEDSARARQTKIGKRGTQLHSGFVGRIAALNKVAE
jgi:hypothetical protein